MAFLAAHISDAAWAELSRASVANAPAKHADLMFGLLEQVGTPDEVARIVADLLVPAEPLLPDLRLPWQATLAAVMAVAQTSSQPVRL
jgi:hypothetical protein